MNLFDLEKFRETRDLSASRFNPSAADPNVADAPRFLLRRALQTIGEANRAIPVFDAASILETACTNLAGYITLAYPGTRDEPLLVEILRDAFAAYGRGARRSASGAALIVAFLRTVGDAADKVLSFEATGTNADGEQASWRPWESGLQTAIAVHQWTKLEFRPVRPNEFEAQAAPDYLLTRILSVREYGRYKALAEEFT